MASFLMPKFRLPQIQIINNDSSDLISSKLYNEDTFYKRFIRDLYNCDDEIIIESPFITSTRMYSIAPILRSLVNRKVKCYIITRDPDDHDLTMKQQAEKEIRKLQASGVRVLLSNEYSHRKLAIIDRKILYEGSLNILSQSMSREIMRRIVSPKQAQDCFDFVRFGKFIY